jgi:EmrB/QacA subfamily drug resistance transporter
MDSLSRARRDSPLPGERTTHRGLATAAVLFGTFVSAIEMTIVGTAMPRIAGALGGSDRFAWVISVYLLTNTVAAPLSGKLADLYGRKPVYIASMLLFLLGSALSGAAPTMNVLIVSRAIQGMGGGGVATVALTLVGDLYNPVERGRIQGFFSAVWGSAGALGPVAGGFIVDHLSWRWIFYLNLPFGGIATLLLWFALHEKIERKDASLDVLGAVILTAAVAVIQLAGGGHGVRGASRPALLGMLGVALFVAFVIVESRAKAPILPTSLVRRRLIGTALLSSLLAGAVMFAVITYLPLYVQGVQGASAREAGIVMTPLSVAWPIVGVAAGFAISRIDPRLLVRSGMLLVACGALLPCVVTESSPRTLFIVSGLIVGAGMGLSSTPFLISLQTAVDWSQRGVVTAAFSFCRTMGGTLGVILASAIQTAQLEAHHVPSTMVDAALRPGAALAPAIVRTALASGLHSAFIASGALGVLAAIAAFAFPRNSVMRSVPAPVIAHE